MLPKILNITGAVLMTAVILSAVPCTLPKLLGYHVYSVLTGSMKPDIPTGSMIYVKDTEFEDFKAGDIVTFYMGTKTDLAATHRVAEIDYAQKQLITKGDANESQDVNPVPETQIIGKVVFHLPYFGRLSYYIGTWGGMAAALLIFAAAFLMWEAAAKLKVKENAK